tara:strand:+ start:386 stop:559 length:174 start_codon:yes stop_codon:yes gene_type:complete
MAAKAIKIFRFITSKVVWKPESKQKVACGIKWYSLFATNLAEKEVALQQMWEVAIDV